MAKFISTYLLVLLCFLVADAIWLLGIAKSIYAAQMGGLLRPKPNLAAAGMFYLLYPVGLTLFGILRAPQPDQLASVASSAALFGFFAYLTYNATNHSVMQGYPLTVAIVDTLWAPLPALLHVLQP